MRVLAVLLGSLALLLCARGERDCFADQDLVACDLRFQRPSVALPRPARICTAILNRDALLDEGSITLASHGGLNRLERLHQQCVAWKGTCSVVVHLTECSELAMVSRFVDTLGKDIKYPTYISVVQSGVGDDMYPINMLRGIAAWQAGLFNSDKLIMLDADAIIGVQESHMRSEMDKIQGSHSSLLAIPAFEFKAGNEAVPIPTTKDELIRYIRTGVVQPMHYPKASYAFNMEGWTSLESPMLFQFRLMAEPYLAGRASIWQIHCPYNELFTGWGLNKQSNVFEIWGSGKQIFLSASSFIFDSLNPQAVGSRRASLAKNQDAWRQFRSHVALYYGIECRDSMWRICDDRGLHCDKVCSLSTQIIPTVDDHDNKPPQPKIISSWELFKSWTQIQASQGTSEPFPISRDDCLSQFDVVYTWVNGSETRHKELQRQHIPQRAFEISYKAGHGRVVAHSLAFRFRDFGEASTLKYSIASVLRNIPRVRKIFVVIADEQTPPSFINVNHPRIEVVRHSQLMRVECLPTFNSCAIETSIHRIPGLSQCYFYLNDDVFALKHIEPSWYWPPSEPLPRAVFNGREADIRSKDEWQQKLARMSRFLQSHLQISKVFLSGHYGHFFIRPVVEQLFEDKAMAGELRRTECERWRTKNSFWLPAMYQNYLIARWKTHAVLEEEHYHVLTEWTGKEGLLSFIRQVEEDVDPDSRKWMCINDMLSENVDDAIIKMLETSLRKWFPTKTIEAEGMLS